MMIRARAYADITEISAAIIVYPENLAVFKFGDFASKRAI